MTKLNRRSGFDDVLFAVAVLVPVVCATARFVDSERQADVVAQAQQRATAVVEEIVVALSRDLPVPALIDHPWLARSLTEAFAFEFMEGTTPIQLANVHAGYLRREVPV